MTLYRVDQIIENEVTKEGNTLYHSEYNAKMAAESCKVWDQIAGEYKTTYVVTKIADK